MIKKQVAFLSPLLPLFVVIVLALFGLILQFRVYLMLVIVCPVAAGIIWFICRDGAKGAVNSEICDKNKKMEEG